MPKKKTAEPKQCRRCQRILPAGHRDWKYCDECRHIVMKKSAEKVNAARAAAKKPCVVCNKPVIGYGRYCKECRNARQREQRREKRGLKRNPTDLLSRDVVKLMEYNNTNSRPLSYGFAKSSGVI